MSGNKNIISIKELKKLTYGIDSDNFQDDTDPKYIGPGTWNVIHRYAFNSRTLNEQKNFIKFMNEVCHGFPCSVCKKHCSEYIKNHPMEQYLKTIINVNGKSEELGMFIWSWKFHNAVNSRLKKNIMSWQTAYDLYSKHENLTCNKSCTENDSISNQSKEKNVQM